MVTIEVDQFLAVDWGCIDEGGFLRVVNEVAGVYT
jgi:hypothetical protein